MTDYTKTTGNDTADGVLGCGVALVLAAFFIGLFFFREPDTEWKRELAEETQRREAVDAIRLENTKTACNAGVQTACVEYAEMID